MTVLKNMFKFSLMYIFIVFLTIAMLSILAEIGIVSTPLMFIYLIIVVLITIKFADYYWRRDFKNIWHISISQALLYSSFSFFLYVGDLLGSSHSGGVIDFGVEFVITILAMLAGFWIIPSIIVSIIYSVMIHKYDAEYKRKNYIDSDSKE